MNDGIFVTAIVPVAHRTAAQSVAAAQVGGAGMFTAACSATGTLPATHYLSSGFVNVAVRDVLVNTCPYVSIDTDAPHVVLSRVGLKLVVTPES